MEDNITAIRPPAVAGLFYPDNAEQLRTDVLRLLSLAKSTTTQPKAIIAPHAGYIYSGPIAASAYATLISGAHTINRVVLLGPAHRIAFTGLAVPSTYAFATPLGNVPVDQASIRQLLALPQVKRLDAAHAAEHSLEVHLPFLQTVLHAFSVVPLVVGRCQPHAISEVLDRLWGGDETIIIISSDLSHYHDYITAQHMDRATALAIEELHPAGVDAEEACGQLPINGLLLAAKAHRLQPHLLDLRNSGDTAGSRDRVVGYGAFIFQ